nr:ribonuclease H-like domain-containing protein [Tanacetum cinerariifolium]
TKVDVADYCCHSAGEKNDAAVKGVDHLIKDCNFHAKPKTQPTLRNSTHRGYDKQYASSTKKYPLKHIVHAAVITKSKPVSVTATRPGNPQHALKDKGVIDSNSKGGKITGKGKIKIDSLLPIPFWVEAVNTPCYVQNRLLVTKPQNKTPYELLHGRPPSTGPTWLFDIDSLIRTMNYQPVTAGNQSKPSAGFQEEFDAGKTGEEAIQQYMLFPVWSTGSTNPQNKEGDATFDGNEHSVEHPESTVNLSPSNSALSGEQDDITKKREKRKSHVDYFTGNRDFNEDFEDYSEDNSNDVSAAGPIVPTDGQNYSNSTNLISVAGPLNSNTSPIHGNFSFQKASQSYDMPENEDIVYSDHENVSAEADFNNLETSITDSPIPTIRIHNAHPISQIIVLENVAIKSSNDVTRLQDLVDKKGVVVTEATIRNALHLDDAEEVDCFPNEEIFTELARMGYEKPTTKLAFYKAFFSSQWKFLIHTILQSMIAKLTFWNVFSSAMASAMICLSTGRKFNFLRRVGKGCLRVKTPLCEGMIEAKEPENQGNAEEQGNEEEQGTDNAAAEEPITAVDDVVDQSIQSPTPFTTPPQQPQDIPSTSHV